MAKKGRAKDEEDTEPKEEAEELTKLLKSFTKEQLIDIIRSVSTENTKIIEKIRKRAFQSTSHPRKSAPKKIGNRMHVSDSTSSDQQQMNVKKNFAQRKIFVGNVSSNSEITAEKLHKFFSQFGEIERGPLGFDKDTGKPKGYALFIYKSVEGARKALEKTTKNFNGHTLHCAISTGGSSNGSNKQKSSSSTPTESLTLKNDGCDSAAMATTIIQPRAGALEVKKSVCENSRSCQANTSHQIGPSGHGSTLALPRVCGACFRYYLRIFMLFILCLVGVLFLLSKVF